VTDDFIVGRLLETLDRLGGFSELLPSVEGVSSEDTFEAADRAERRGYINGSVTRNAAGRLSVIFNVRITARGTAQLLHHRRTIMHQSKESSAMPDLDGSMQARRLRRTTFMKAVYDATGGSEVQFVDGPSLGDAFSWPRPETDDIMRYWEGEGLIRYVTEEGAIAITHKGVVEIEEALAQPERATPHFAPNTIVIYGDVHSSQIQSGSPGSSQMLTSAIGTDGASEDVVSEFLTALRAALVEEPLTEPGESAEVEEMIALVEAERAQPEPNKRLTATLTNGLRDIALGMAASGGWAGAVALAHQLPH
jgi:hypothetical protein